MLATMPVEKGLVEAVTKFVDALHRRYAGITIQPIAKYEDEDLTFEVTIPKALPYDQVLAACQRECINIEDEFALFIFPHVVYEEK